MLAIRCLLLACLLGCTPSSAYKFEVKKVSAMAERMENGEIVCYAVYDRTFCRWKETGETFEVGPVLAGHD